MLWEHKKQCKKTTKHKHKNAMLQYDELTKQIQRTRSSLINVSKYWLRKRRPGPMSVVSSIPISVLDIWAICHSRHTHRQTMWQM